MVVLLGSSSPAATSISNCFTNVSLINGSGSCGGITGLTSACTITNCYTLGSINPTPALTGSGGIVAGSSSSTITNCYSVGNIGGECGGIAGLNFTGTINNCYSTGTLTSPSGGLVGHAASGATVENSYSLYATGGGIGTGQLVQSGTATITNCGFNSGAAWPASSTVLTYLQNNLGSYTNVWADVNGNSPPIATGPFLLNSFLSAPFEHTSYTDSTGFKTGTPSCYNEGTKITCLVDEQEIDIPIEHLRPGTLVKTYKYGYKKINLIGYSQLHNDPNVWYSCMYKHSKTGLMITGLHSILVDIYSPHEIVRQKYLWGNNFMTNPRCRLDDKYLILCSTSDEFEKMDNTDYYTYYHLCLEDEDETKQFGIWPMEC